MQPKEGLMRQAKQSFAAAVFTTIATAGLPVPAHCNGTPASSSAAAAGIQKQKGRITAQKENLEAQNALIAERHRLLGDDFGNWVSVDELQRGP
jgi:hypothetical protein